MIKCGQPSWSPSMDTTRALQTWGHQHSHIARALPQGIIFTTVGTFSALSPSLTLSFSVLSFSSSFFGFSGLASILGFQKLGISFS